MTDLLTHVLVAYAVGTVLRWRSPRVGRRHVALAMAGATLPDLAKVRLLLPGDAVTTVLGVGVSPLAFHRIGPALALALATALLVERDERAAVAVALVAGVCSHFLLDLGVIRAAPTAPPYLYPLTWWRPPNPELYQSSDLLPSLVAVVLAAAVWALDRRRDCRAGGRSSADPESSPEPE